MGMTIVTGGAGFLGANLCRRLLDDGARVVAVDNFFTGSRANVEALSAHPRFSLVEHDVIEPCAARWPTSGERIDAVYNLACPASPPRYQGPAAVFTMKTCFMGALNMLELARAHGARILQASTSEVYGEPLEHPQTEAYRGNVNPIGIRACYDEGKRVAEALCFEFRRQYGVAVKVVRIFNTYGPFMDPDDGRVVSNFINQALRGEPITLYGDGAQTRSFCFVDDLVEGLVRMMRSPDDCTGPVNLGNPEEFTVRQLAERVAARIPTAHAFAHRPLPADDPTQRRPDIARAKALLDWAPTVGLDAGLDRTIAYFRARQAARG